MKDIFLTDPVTVDGASLEGIQVEFKTPPNASRVLNAYPEGGYIYLEVAANALITSLKFQARFFNGAVWMKYHDLVDDDLVTNFDPSSAAIKCEFTLYNQAFWKKPIYGIQIKYVRTTGTGDAIISNSGLEVFK